MRLGALRTESPNPCFFRNFSLMPNVAVLWYVCNQNLVPVRVSVCARAVNFTTVWCIGYGVWLDGRISRFAVGLNRLVSSLNHNTPEQHHPTVTYLSSSKRTYGLGIKWIDSFLCPPHLNA